MTTDSLDRPALTKRVRSFVEGERVFVSISGVKGQATAGEALSIKPLSCGILRQP
jgi:hypothetical protein